MSKSTSVETFPDSIRSDRWLRIIAASRTLAKFSLGQVAIQALTALTGLCLVRWLTIADYAQFGFSFSFQSSLTLIVDLGTTSAVIALIGNQYRDRLLVGTYLKAGFALRSRLVVIAATVGIVAFAYLSNKQGWPLSRQIVIFAIIMLGLLAQFWSSLYAVPLILNHRLGTYYGAQVGASLLRLTCVFALYRSYLLGSATALATGCLAALVTALIFKRVSRAYWEESRTVQPEAKRKLLGYITPLAPVLIFMSIQSQVTVLIVSYFGVARPIAEVSALGRLGQIFTLLGAFNGIVLGPRFARLDVMQLKGLYLRALASVTAIAVIAGCCAMLWPDLLLWLLGSKYTNLTESLRYVVWAGCIGYVSSTLWNIHSARQWIYWWSTWYSICIVTAVQVLGIIFLNVTTTLGACQLAFLDALAVLTVHTLVGAYSLKKVPGSI